MAALLVPNNIYVISCAASNTLLDLVDGSPKNGAECHSNSDQSDNIKWFDELWLVKEVDSQPGTYTLQNVHSGTYLDLAEGKKTNGTKIQGWAKAPTGHDKNQHWKLIPTGTGSYCRIQNVAGGTYVDIKDGYIKPGGIIQGWEHRDAMTQEWKFRRVSRTADQIKELVKGNPFTAQQESEFKSYFAGGLYLTLHQKLVDDIYGKAGLKKMKRREEIFDCNDFAFSAKTAVAKWTTDNLHADGFAILFGIMFGRNRHGDHHAYNWYLNNHLDEIVFFEPQNGTHQDYIEYEAYFGVF